MRKKIPESGGHTSTKGNPLFCSAPVNLIVVLCTTTTTKNEAGRIKVYDY